MSKQEGDDTFQIHIVLIVICRTDSGGASSENPREMGGGRILTYFFNLNDTQLILCHFPLTIFADFWELGGGRQILPSPPVAPPLRTEQRLREMMSSTNLR